MQGSVRFPRRSDGATLFTSGVATESRRQWMSSPRHSQGQPTLPGPGHFDPERSHSAYCSKQRTHQVDRGKTETMTPMSMVAAATTVSIWAKIGYVVGVVGVAFAAIRWWNDRRERKRVRPVVIAHERAKRHLNSKRQWVASVYLTNESATSSFNIRFGIQIGAAEVPWKHDPADPAASRLNVMAASGRYPDGQGVVEVVIPDEIVFSMEGDPESGRRYWARYESPSGERWYTSNPENRSSDLIVKRVRSRRWSEWNKSRVSTRQTNAGRTRMAAINRELREAMLEQIQKEDDSGA